MHSKDAVEMVEQKCKFGFVFFTTIATAVFLNFDTFCGWLSIDQIS